MSEEIRDPDAPKVEVKTDNNTKETTQVKTIQQMSVEQQAPQPKAMTPEQYQSQLLLDHHIGMMTVVPGFKNLSQHGKDRLFTALMQLPQAGLEVKLQKDEKLLYLAAQKALMAKHAIIFNRAKREADAEKKAILEVERQRTEAQKINLTNTSEVTKVEESTDVQKENQNV
jgi:hypothetical protein